MRAYNMRTLFLAAAALTAFATPAMADEYLLTIKDHKFDPSTLEISAGTAHKLTVRNMDAAPEEFESEGLHIEKLIGANQEAHFDLAPLKSGTYTFVGEHHEDTAKGVLVVK